MPLLRKIGYVIFWTFVVSLVLFTFASTVIEVWYEGY